MVLSNKDTVDILQLEPAIDSCSELIFDTIAELKNIGNLSKYPYVQIVQIKNAILFDEYTPLKDFIRSYPKVDKNLFIR